MTPEERINLIGNISLILPKAAAFADNDTEFANCLNIISNLISTGEEREDIVLDYEVLSDVELVEKKILTED